MVPGKGSELGNAVAEDPNIDMISFTGSTPVGRELAQADDQPLTHREWIAPSRDRPSAVRGNRLSRISFAPKLKVIAVPHNRDLPEILDKETHMTRRRFPVAALTALLLMAAAPAAQAGPARPMDDVLPPIGQEIELTGDAPDTPLQIRDSAESVHFTGGLRVKVEADPDDPLTSRRLQVSGMRFTGNLADGGGRARQDGTITIEQNDVDVDAKSLLKLTQKFPPRYEQVMVLGFTMTIDQPDRAEPLVLTTKEPAKLIGQLTQFPPSGDIYQLRNPVDLVLPDNPDDTVATLQQFPVKVGGL
ncbi:hypothetical protein GCM10017567_18430 [Amycolatopsis bullii]|uniref:Aldehyde dehydrogenase domain-containing protein n=1 Tax=Amycolatopsis bullii TaxID=941987 RepID=A0ABQ3K5M9_9PSEU|nr:hypothetical protein GCM10017567_18430 [Amycolatopsis bullii]